MRENYILDAWRNDRNINCAMDDPAKFLAAVDQLQADGFSHVLYHPGLPTARGIRAGITSFTPSYEDAYVLIYDMDDLRQSCHSSNLLHQELFAPLGHLARHRAILPDENVSIISVHPSQAADYAVFKSQAAALSGWNGLLHTFHVNDELIIQSLDSRYSDAGDIVKYDDGLVLIYNPPLTGTSQLPEVESILSESYRLCERALDTDDAIVEFHAKPFLPCELVFSDTKQRVHYDSGLQMRNLHYELYGKRLDFYALWQPTRDLRHAFSIQLFAENGQKAIGQDYVIHFDRVHYPVDLESLAPGAYEAKLIVYNYDSGASIAGRYIDTGVRVNREFVFARLLFG